MMDAWAPPQDWISGPDGPGHMVGRLRVYTVDDLKHLPARSYVVKGIMAPGEISLLIGPPKSAKSFLALHLAYAIAQGRSVFGRRVHQTPVLYVAGEGERGIAKRVEALAREYGPCDAFHLIAQPADLLHRDAGSGDLHDLILPGRLVKAGVVVLDTLNRLSPGGDENASSDMGRFIGNISDLCHDTGAHVAVVHHGSQASDGRKPRGHSSLPAAADLILEIAKADNDSRIATIAAAKDDPDGHALGFRLRPVELDADEDGDPVTTLLVEELAQIPVAKPRLTPKAVTARHILADLIVAHGELLPAVGGFPSSLRGVREDAWQAECDTRRLSAAAEARDRRKVFRSAYAELLEARVVAARDGWVWLTSSEGQA